MKVIKDNKEEEKITIEFSYTELTDLVSSFDFERVEDYDLEICNNLESAAKERKITMEDIYLSKLAILHKNKPHYKIFSNIIEGYNIGIFKVNKVDFDDIKKCVCNYEINYSNNYNTKERAEEECEKLNKEFKLKHPEYYD